LKNIFILIQLLIIYCMGSFSCKEKKKESYRDLFIKDSLAMHVPESTPAQATDLGFELSTDYDINRGTWQNPELVIRKFGDLSGKIIADIGSGTGYFTIPISRLASRVVAIDIEQRYLDYIEDRKLELPIAQADRIETRLTVENEPNLHTDEVDAVLMVNVFYYLNNRINYMEIVRDALRKNGILVLVDFKTGDLPVGPAENKVPAEEVVKILLSAGFVNVVVDDESLQYQYIITAN
jgi:SAM-dependent methyltransferase